MRARARGEHPARALGPGLTTAKPDPVHLITESHLNIRKLLLQNVDSRRTSCGIVTTLVNLLRGRQAPWEWHMLALSADWLTLPPVGGQAFTKSDLRRATRLKSERVINRKFRQTQAVQPVTVKHPHGVAPQILTKDRDAVFTASLYKSSFKSNDRRSKTSLLPLILSTPLKFLILATVEKVPVTKSV